MNLNETIWWFSFSLINYIDFIFLNKDKTLSKCTIRKNRYPSYLHPNLGGVV